MRNSRPPILTALLVLAVAPTARGQVLEDVFERVHASVVTIRAVQRGVSDPRGADHAASITVGSGVLISEEGEILTAAHVVELADHIEVEFVGGSVMRANIVASEPGPDLALLQLEGEQPPSAVVAKLGDSDEVRVASRIFIIGAPLNMSHSLTVGYISARRKEESFLGSMRSIEHFQTDASVNMGNSGGPMFSAKGEVVGIVCHMTSPPSAGSTFGFVVTSNAVRELLLDRKGVWLGFDAIPLSSELSRALNVPGESLGLLVQRVAPSSPAEALGLRGGTIQVMSDGRELLLGGDVVLEVLGMPVGSPQQVDAVLLAIRQLSLEAEFSMTVLRGGKIVELSGSFPR